MTRRILLSYLLLAAFVLAVVVLPLGVTYAGRQQDRLLADVERDARVLAGLVEERVEDGDTAAVERIVARYTDQTGGRVVITNASGLSMVDTSRPDDQPRDFSTRPEFRTALSGSQRSGIRASETLGQELAYVAVPIASGAEIAGAVRVSFPTDTLRHQVLSNWLRLGLLSVLVLASAASLGWLVSRWAVAPVADLESGARRLAAGDLAGRVQVDRGPPELRRLATTFNDMAARVEVLVHSQRSFVADASHQLRTPLTALRLRLETLEDEVSAGDLDGAAPEVAAIADEVERLSALVEALLALARSEAAAPVTVEVDAAATADGAVARWEALAEEHGVMLWRHGPPAVAARAVSGALEQILDNLLDNAIEVAPAGSAIDVGVVPDGGGVVVSVRDHGPGLTAADRARATDRFWRGPASGPGGTGLGLSIVQELARAGGGSVTLDDPADGAGLVVRVRLPAG